MCHLPSLKMFPLSVTRYRVMVMTGRTKNPVKIAPRED